MHYIMAGDHSSA